MVLIYEWARLSIGTCLIYIYIYYLDSREFDIYTRL